MFGSIIHDGGRMAAGYKDTTGDCVTRAIAIATNKPYIVIYEYVNQMTKRHIDENTVRVYGYGSKDGVPISVVKKMMKHLGFKWNRMEKKVSMYDFKKNYKVPKNCVLYIPNHLVAVKQGILHDSYYHYDVDQKAKRVLGYWV